MAARQVTPVYLALRPCQKPGGPGLYVIINSLMCLVKFGLKHPEWTANLGNWVTRLFIGCWYLQPPDRMSDNPEKVRSPVEHFSICGLSRICRTWWSKPYVRTVALDLSQRGSELGDVQDFSGHKATGSVSRIVGNSNQPKVLLHMRSNYIAALLTIISASKVGQKFRKHIVRSFIQFKSTSTAILDQ